MVLHSKADKVYYYFPAVLSTPADLRPFYSEHLELLRTGRPSADLEKKLLQSLKTDRDLLTTYRLDKARTSYGSASADAFAGYAGAVNPTYITLSGRVHRDRFVTKLQANNHGPIFNKLRAA